MIAFVVVLPLQYHLAVCVLKTGTANKYIVCYNRNYIVFLIHSSSAFVLCLLSFSLSSVFYAALLPFQISLKKNK